MAYIQENYEWLSLVPSGPISPMRYSGHDAYFPQCQSMLDEDYAGPPNAQWLASEGRPFSKMEEMQLRQATIWNPHQTIHPIDPWPRSYYPDSRIRGVANYSSDSSTTDSHSSRASEERVMYDHHDFMRRFHLSSPPAPAAIYAPPAATHISLGADCAGVTPQEVQQVPDAYSEEQITLDRPSELQHGGTASIGSPQMPATGLPTPSSETANVSHTGDQMQDAIYESDEGDNSGDYSPVVRRSKLKKTKPASPKASAVKSKASKGHRVTKSVPKLNTSAIIAAAQPSKALSPTQCDTCGQEQPSKLALSKHIQTAHTRPFACIFNIYGCTATFGAKNEWKRHCSTQHLRLSFYRCDVGACVPQNAQQAQHSPDWDVPIASSQQAGWNDFNRKDLFIQHHRRMHAPENFAQANSAEKERFKAACERTARRCRVAARKPPPKTICGLCEARGCGVTFEGPSAWETRMEHVGRHLESAKGEPMEWKEDEHLRQWLIDEGLLQPTSHGGWRLTDLVRSDESKAGRR